MQGACLLSVQGLNVASDSTLDCVTEREHPHSFLPVFGVHGARWTVLFRTLGPNAGVVKGQSVLMVSIRRGGRMWGVSGSS